MADVPQSNYQNNQNFNLNIQKMYKDYITGSSTPNDGEVGEIIGIDDIRGEISVTVTGTTTKNLIESLNINPTSKKPAPTPNTATPVQLAQESRCHAFYRIIGFPVISQDKNLFYNPGFDVIKIKGTARSVSLDDKIRIASNVGAKFEAISQTREVYASSTAQIFSVPSSVEAGVLTLTSGTYGSKGSPNIRKFNAPFEFNKSLDAFDFNASHQAYSSPGDILTTSTLSGSKEFLLADFQDGNGVKPNPGIGGYKVLLQHEHIIVPFMVDPRIDFSIWGSKSKTVKGASKRIAVPFAPDAIYLKVGSDSQADTPLLEKIITKRFANFNDTTDAGQAAQQQVSYIKNIKSVLTDGATPLDNIFSNDIFQLSQQNMFNKTIKKIRAMVDALVAAMNVIHARQGNYYWLPIPSQNGPEGGCSIRDVPINENVNVDLLTINDIDIITNQLHFFMNNINSNTTQANAVPDIAGARRTSPSFTFDSDTSDSEGDTTAETKETLTKRRNRILGDAGEALQVVEMIMGEFSGLGLCDIIAIMGALYVIPPEFLLGFLDDDAYERAKIKLNKSLPKKKNIVDTMNTFASYVSAFYQIMDATFQNTFGERGLDS